MKKDKKRNTQYRIDQGFFPSYLKVFTCGEINYIKDGKEQSIKWDIYSSVVYSFIFNRYNYFNNVQMSYEYIAAYCNCSVKTVMDRVAIMESCRILTITRGKTLGGHQATNKYSNVEDITNSTAFKLKMSKTFKAYQKTIEDRKKRVELLQGIRVDSKWTNEQVRNFIRNKNYELRTGLYLSGDKLNEKLYLSEIKGKTVHMKSNGFSGKDELKEYELKQIIETAEVVEDELLLDLEPLETDTSELDTVSVVEDKEDNNGLPF